MQFTLQHGYPDYVGRRFLFCGSGKGPASYVNTGTQSTSGDPLALPRFDNYIDAITTGGNQSVSGTYYYHAQSSGPGPRATWVLRYFVTSTNAEVANGVNLSAETFVVGGFGGDY
jgi:hypothetical protein